MAGGFVRIIYNCLHKGHFHGLGGIKVISLSQIYDFCPFFDSDFAAVS